MTGIRIHRSGRMTDPALAEALSAQAPTAFRKAQDVLVAAQKYQTKAGRVFSTEASRAKALESELIALDAALQRDQYPSISKWRAGGQTRAERLVSFFNAFSDAFPNWQDEYQLIEKAIMRRFI